MTWAEYINSSIGIRIFFCVSILFLVGIIICSTIEKKKMANIEAFHADSFEKISAIKRLFIGMFIGFTLSVTIGVVQFLLRFGYFSLMQEIGSVFLGFIGAVIGGLVALIKFRRKPSRPST
jgi:hypothetical protein